MNFKRRLSRLECQPIRRKKNAREILESILTERAADPEGCEIRRQKLLREMGFPEGYDPTPGEILEAMRRKRRT